MTHNFRVLVIDDDEEVIGKLLERIETQPHPFEGRTYRIEEPQTLHVKVEKVDEQTSRISDSTIEELAQLCSQPFHVIFADYGYAKKEVIEELKLYAEKLKQLPQPRNMPKEELKGKVLMTYDLASAIQQYVSNESIDADKRQNVEKEST